MLSFMGIMNIRGEYGGGFGISRIRSEAVCAGINQKFVYYGRLRVNSSLS